MAWITTDGGKVEEKNLIQFELSGDAIFQLQNGRRMFYVVAAVTYALHLEPFFLTKKNLARRPFFDYLIHCNIHCMISTWGKAHEKCKAPQTYNNVAERKRLTPTLSKRLRIYCAKKWFTSLKLFAQ